VDALFTEHCQGGGVRREREQSDQRADGHEEVALWRKARLRPASHLTMGEPKRLEERRTPRMVTLATPRLEAQAEGDTEVRPFLREAGVDAKHRIPLEGHAKADPVVRVHSRPGQCVE
jgi:hypothetical protein